MIGMKNTIARFRLDDEAPAAAYPPLPLVGDGIWYHPRMVMTPGGRRRGGRHAPVPSAAEQRRRAARKTPPPSATDNNDSCDIKIGPAATLLLRLHHGVQRAAIGALFPTAVHPVLVIDGGANVDCDARELVNFAHLGSVYARDVLSSSPF